MTTTIDTPAEVLEVREELLRHPIYERIRSLDDLRVFMSHHVFAVWDFFSLAKRIQRHVTCVEVPWMPPADPISARLINHIVLSEESDEDGRGGYASHLDLYRESMRELKADDSALSAYLALLKNGHNPVDALHRVHLPPGVEQFVHFDLTLALERPIHQVASAFCFGREDLISDMFGELVKPMEQNGLGLQHTRFKHYIDRHIVLDGHEHAPLARRLVEILCGDDPQRRREATEAAVDALKARIGLWDGVMQALESRTH